MTHFRQITTQPVGQPRSWILPRGDRFQTGVAPAETQILAVIGPQGPAGRGIPAGGIDGQLLAKSGPQDFDTQWIDVDFSSIAVTIDGGNF